MDIHANRKAVAELNQLYVEMNGGKIEPPKEKLKTDRNMFNIPKGEQDAARERLLAKAKAKREAMKTEALDPVGKEDADIDNDGDTDKSDKYLHKRRKAIGKAIAKKKGMKEENEINEIHGQAHKPHEVPGTNLKGLVKKAVKRIDTDVDGDTDKNDKAKGELGEFIPGVGNKRLYSTTGTKTAKESFSNWRNDLREVVDTEDQDKQIKEKKVKNKVTIDPDLKLEAIAHELGAEIIEVIELDEGSLKPGESYMDYAKRKQAERSGAADKRMTVTAADKKANTPAYQKYKAGDKRYKSASHLGEDTIEEKAMSRAQQRFMGMVYAAKKGEAPASPEVAKAASGMSKKAAKDFAGTKHKGLPEKKVAKEEIEIDEATAMAKRGYDEAPIRQKIAKSTGGGKSADRATELEKKPTFGNDKAAKQRSDLARKQRGDFRKTTSSSPGLHVGQHKSDDPKVKAKQAARGAQRGALTPSEKKQLNREEFGIEEGMTLKDFKANRRKIKRKEASDDAKKRGHVGKEWYNSGRTYSPDEAKSGRANMQDHERSTRHRSAMDPEGDDSNYSADKTKNPKKLRKQKAMGEGFITELNRAEKETGVNTKTGRPTQKGGMKDDKAFTMVKQSIRKMEGTPAGQRKKEKGKKPPVAGQYGAPKSPAQKLALRRAAAKRAQDNMSSRFD